jgi:ABC-type antimicrobial peptide transport system permease subunit
VGQLVPQQPAQNPDEQERHLGALAGIQGYDLRSGSLPDAFVNLGRPLAASDAASANVLVRSDLQRSPFFLRVGDAITATQPASGRTVTLRVAGFYLPVSRGSSGLRFAVFLQPILADRSVVDAIAGSELQTVVSMKLDPSAKDAALHRLETAAPGVEVLDLADYAALINQFLSNLVVLLVAIASLALFAGIVIIGNTVALAMLERRREIGVLKAVGHSSRSVLSQVLVENGIVALVGAVAGMAAVSLTMYLLGRYLLQTDLAVGTPIVVAVVIGIVGLVVATATLVAWGPTRVRPLEVLRYE